MDGVRPLHLGAMDSLYAPFFVSLDTKESDIFSGFSFFLLDKGGNRVYFI